MSVSGECPALRTCCQLGYQQRASGEGRKRRRVLQLLTSASYRALEGSTWTLARQCHRSPQQSAGTGRLGPDGHNSLSSPTQRVLQPHPFLRRMLAYGNHKRCLRKWCPTPRISPRTMRPWLHCPGTSHRPCIDQTVPACWVC